MTFQALIPSIPFSRNQVEAFIENGTAYIENLNAIYKEMNPKEKVQLIAISIFAIVFPAEMIQAVLTAQTKKLGQKKELTKCTSTDMTVLANDNHLVKRVPLTHTQKDLLIMTIFFALSLHNAQMS